ncbi:hypothetical protein fHeYen902_019c [Yersinia phage fHe-Yen9-02]|nr:hypothetical protein fHeYen902_019c [Yersinia phage fHe-Yen9-02]
MLEIQLPSGRVDASIKPFTADAMASLYNASHYKQPQLFVNTIQRFVTVDLFSMYLEDFRYLIALMDKDSWLEGFRLYEWRCTKPFYVDCSGTRSLERPSGRKFRSIDCDMLNSTEAARQRIKTEKWRTLPEGVRHPTVQHWIEAEELAEEYGELAYHAMWVDSDLPVVQTLARTSIADLMYASNFIYSVCSVVTVFKCNRCFREYTHEAPIEILNFLRVYSAESMMNMTLDITKADKIYIPEDVPLRKLLYWHSCFLKDKQAEAEAKAKRDAIKTPRGRRR